MATLQPPETHYKHLYKHERSPSGLTFEEMLKYVPQNEIEYNILMCTVGVLRGTTLRDGRPTPIAINCRLVD